MSTFIWCLHVCFFFPDVVISKSATVSITFEVGNITFVELPEVFRFGSRIAGKASKSFLDVTEVFIGSLS